MAVFTSQSNSIPILSAVTSPFRACLSLSAPAPVDRPPPQRAVQTEMEGGQSSDHHRTDKESPLTFPEASVAAVLFRRVRQVFYSPPHTAIPFIEKRDPCRVDEPGSLKGGLCQIRIHLTNQSVPLPPPKGRRESYEEDGRDDGMMGMSYRVSYYTMASLGSSRGEGLAQLAFMAHWAFTLLHCNQERVRRSLQVLRFDYEGTSPRRKTQLMCKVLQSTWQESHSLIRQTDAIF